jgi:hypothetical protein
VRDLAKEMPAGRRFRTLDTALLKEMQRSWVFIYTAGDVATVESRLMLYKDGKIMFSTGIVLDEQGQGLQSPDFGWLEPLKEVRLSRQCSRFRRVGFLGL